MRWLTWALLAALWVAPALAEMDASDYKIDEVITSGKVRDKIKAEIAREMDQEARQAQRDAEEEARQRAQAEAEEARRPYPQRLLQSRCTLCHLADNYLNQRHTALGWHGVIARMRWLNRAPIAWDEHFVLANELARLRPAAAADAVLEVGAGTAALALPLVLLWGLGRWRRQRRH